MTAEANTSLRWRFLTLSADQLIFKWSQAQVLFFLSEEIRVGSSLWRKLDYFRKTFLKRSHEELRFWTWLNLYIKWNPYPPTPISCAKKKKKTKKKSVSSFFSLLFFFFFSFSFLFNISFKDPRKSMWAACSLRTGGKSNENWKLYEDGNLDHTIWMLRSTTQSSRAFSI